MKQHMNGFLFELNQGGWMHISPVAPCTFRIRLNETGKFPEAALLRYGIISERSRRCPYSTEHHENTITVRTEAAALSVNTHDGQFCFEDDSGRICLQTAQAPRSSSSNGFDIRFEADADEAVYGLGDVAPDQINRRGQRVDMWVAGTNYHSPIPFFMSSRGWAILMNTTWKHTVDIMHEAENEIRIGGAEGELDLYLFYGKDYAELLNRYTDVAGKPFLLPVWAYGLHYFCSVESGGRQVVEDALKFRQEGIPCDLIGLSDGWMAEERGGSGTRQWDMHRFVVNSDPSQGSSAFIDTLHRHGFKLSLMLIYDNRDVSGYVGRHFTTLSSAGQETEISWYDQLFSFVKDGVDGFKLPSANLTNAHPERSYANGMSDNELHNLHPILLYKQMYEGYRNQTGKRPMIHAVVGYTGMQRFMATECGKYGLRSTAVISALNSGLSGHSHTAIHMHVAEPEGIHAAFLLPWSQNNSGRHFRHPCFLEEKQRSLFRMYARLRYRLLPYLYTAAHTAFRTGMPIAKAMPIAFPGDPNCKNLSAQYMLGNDLLVAAFTCQVYLPPGLWIDYWTDKCYEGSCTIQYNVPEHAGGPLFVRAGAILPMRPDMDYIGETTEQLLLHVYPHGDSDSELCEDDGISFRYTDGQVATARFQCNAEQNRIIISIWRRKGTYEGMSEKRSYELIVHTAAKPATVRINGVRLPEIKPHSVRKKTQAGWKYERMTGTIRLIADEPPLLEEPARIEIWHRHNEREPSSFEGNSSEKAPKSSSSKMAEDTNTWLHIALDTCVSAEVESALTAWWSSRVSESESAAKWRTSLLDGCLLLIRHAERRGWTISDGFGSTMANPLSHAEIQTPEQAVALLQQLASEIIAAAKKTIESVRHPIIRETVAYVQRELHTKLSLQQFAERAGIHPVYLSRLFKKEIKLTFSDYVLEQRMDRAKALLESGMKVYEAATLCGFPDASHFSRVYSKYWGRAPISFRKK